MIIPFFIFSRMVFDICDVASTILDVVVIILVVLEARVAS